MPCPRQEELQAAARAIALDAQYAAQEVGVWGRGLVPKESEVRRAVGAVWDIP